MMRKGMILSGLATLLLSPGGAWAAAMPALARQHGCTACHDIDKLVAGPSWIDVSKKYRNVGKYTYNSREYALEDGLVMKVSDGGSGKWGAMPMPPNDPDGTHRDDIRELVRFILNLSR